MLQLLIIILQISLHENVRIDEKVMNKYLISERLLLPRTNYLAFKVAVLLTSCSCNS